MTIRERHKIIVEGVLESVSAISFPTFHEHGFTERTVKIAAETTKIKKGVDERCCRQVFQHELA